MSQGKSEASRRWKSKELDSPLESPEGMQPFRRLDISPVRPIWSSDLHNYKIINVGRFEP